MQKAPLAHTAAAPAAGAILLTPCIPVPPAHATLSRYAKYQGQAGRVVGIPPGEAWRVALRAAVAAGASQASLAWELMLGLGS